MKKNALRDLCGVLIERMLGINQCNFLLNVIYFRKLI